MERSPDTRDVSRLQLGLGDSLLEVESEEDKLLKAIRHSMDVERIDVDSEEDMFLSQSPIKNPFKLEDLDMDAESDKDMFLSSSDSSTKEEKVEVVDSDEDMFAEYYCESKLR